MLVLIITLVPTISNAQTYTSNDEVIISTQYHELFNNYFDGSNSYLYFPYTCRYNNYDRTCYMGIDSKGKFLKVEYVANGSSYTNRIKEGVDEEFSVSGANVVRKGVNNSEVIKYILIFFATLIVITMIFQ